MSDLSIQIGLRIRHARKQLGVSQEQLGRSLGMTGVMILNYEKGRSKIGTELLGKIADLTGVSMAWLLTGDIPEEQRKAQTDAELRVLEALRQIPSDKLDGATEAILGIIHVITKT